MRKNIIGGVIMFINCVENCIHQNDGICNLEQVGTLTNTTAVGCEFYVKKGCSNFPGNIRQHS